MKKIITFIATMIATISFAQITVTKSFSDFNFPNASTNLTGNIDNNISFYTQKNESSTSPSYYNVGASIRFYAGSGNGGSLHFNFENAIIVTDITIKTQPNYAPEVGYAIDGIEGLEVFAIENSYTFNDIEAVNSFSIRNAAMSNTQLRIAEVSITYIAEEDPSNPFINTSVTQINNLNYTELNGPSDVQNFNILGFSLDNSDVTLTASTNFEISLDDELFESTLILESYDGTARTIYTRLASGLDPGNYSGNIVINGGGITTPINIGLSGEVSAIEPEAELTINVTSINNLNYIFEQGPSTTQIFTISGTNVNDSAVLITAPTNFEVSSDNSFFGELASLTPYDGSETSVYIRLATDLPINTYTGNIIINGGGITTPITIAVSGEVTAPTASVKDNNIEGLKVYPNPASDIVYITSNEIGTKEVKIFNMLGKKVLDITTEESINISNLNTGVYIMNITQDGKNASRKLVIK